MTNEERHLFYRQRAAAAFAQQAPVRKQGRGLIGRMREGVAAADAQRALAEGHTVYVMATSNAIQWVSGSSLTSVAEQIEAVEAVGWRLDHSAYVFDASGIGNTLRDVHTFPSRDAPGAMMYRSLRLGSGYARQKGQPVRAAGEVLNCSGSARTDRLLI